jgi:transcriptional regulator with XRE-family HTH domain
LNIESNDFPTSTLPQRQLGRFLREARQAAGLTITQSARQVDLSPAGLQRMEAGKIQKVRRQDVRALCELYGVKSTDIRRAVELADQTKANSHYHAFGGLFSDTFRMFVGLEVAARKQLSYNEQIPGLLQTEDYARALISSLPDHHREEEIDRRVELRLRRQTIVTRKKKPITLEVFLHEAAVHRLVGSPKIMAAQLHHLAEISKLPNVTLRIQRFSAGCVWGLAPEPFAILEFEPGRKGMPTEPPLVFLEGQLGTDVYLEDPVVVQRYHDFVAAVRDSAMDETSTKELLRHTARSYEDDQHRPDHRVLVQEQPQ